MERAQQRQLIWISLQFLAERGADSEPAGKQEAALGPAEHPGNGAEAGEVSGPRLASCGSTGDLQLADLFDRGHLFEEGHQIGVVVHQGSVVTAGTLGQPCHQVIPTGRCIQLIGHQAVLHHRGGHGFEVVERQFGQAVFRSQHLTLLGDLDPALKGSTGLSKDRLVSRATTAADGTATAMEQSQGHAVVGGQILQRDLGFVNFPVAGEEA